MAGSRVFAARLAIRWRCEEKNGEARTSTPLARSLTARAKAPSSSSGLRISSIGAGWMPRIPLGGAVRVPLLDYEIAALDPPELLESLPERVESEGFGIGKQPSDPDHADLLSLGGTRRGDETASDSPEERSPGNHW